MSRQTSTDSIPAFTTFGPLLRYLRLRARLSQRDLAIVAGYSESQISRLEGDQRLPDLDVLRSHVVPALLLDDLPALADRLLELAIAAREMPPLPPAPPPPSSSPSNLPLSLTSMIDRISEVAALVALLVRPELRLLTLTGPPGIGKTRLSLQAAAHMQAQFADGVLFVALALIQDPALVLPTIAQTYGLSERDDRPALTRLAAALRDKQLLLVLDNFEQVVAAAPQLAELLQMAPGVTALVTSRVVLMISGEQQYSVPPLELPATGLRLPTEQLVSYPGVQLFVERVRAVRPNFLLTAENAPIVIEICTRLDGLPLAIELAAARSRLFTPSALLERLNGPGGPTTLAFLTNGPRDLLAHQRTLRGTIDWSYALLSDAERQIFQQLGVFIGGGTAEATYAIGADRLGTAVSGADMTLEVLESLVNQSMVKVEPGPDGTIRFALLEVMREYALDQLEQCDQIDLARQRHASYYAQLVRSTAAYLNGTDQERWLNRLQIEYANVNVALEWHVHHDITGGLRCATALARFWLIRGLMTEGRSWLARLLALDASSGSDRSARAAGLTAAGYLAYQQGHQQQAESLSSEALDLYCQLDDPHGVADALMNLGYVAFHRSAYSRATSIYSECLDLYRKLGERTGVARALRSLALVAKDQGDFARATRLHEENLALCHELGDRRGAASTLLNLSIVAYWKGEYARAHSLAEQAAGIHRDLDDRMGLAYALDQLGMTAYKQDQYRPALALMAESLALFRTLDEKIGMAMVYNDMGIVAQAHGQLQRAAQLQRDGLELAMQIGDQRRAIFCIEALAAAIGSIEPLRAAQLFGAAESLRESLGTPLPAAEIAGYERGVTTARSRVPAQEFNSAWEAGRLCSAEQILAEVVG